MKITELRPGEIYSYSSSPNRIKTRSAIAPIDASNYYQVSTTFEMTRGAGHLKVANRRAYSSGNPDRGLLALVSDSNTEYAVDKLRQFLDPMPTPEAVYRHAGRAVAPGIRWALVNPAWVRESWIDHLDRIEEMKREDAAARVADEQRRIRLDAITNRLHNLVKEQGLGDRLHISHHLPSQQIPNDVLLHLLKRPSQ